MQSELHQRDERAVARCASQDFTQGHHDRCAAERASRRPGTLPPLFHSLSHAVHTGKDILLYFALPLFAVTSYAADYKEREKMRHRF